MRTSENPIGAKFREGSFYEVERIGGLASPKGPCGPTLRTDRARKPGRLPRATLVPSLVEGQLRSQDTLSLGAHQPASPAPGRVEALLDGLHHAGTVRAAPARASPPASPPPGRVEALLDGLYQVGTVRAAPVAASPRNHGFDVMGLWHRPLPPARGARTAAGCRRRAGRGGARRAGGAPL